ncbi:ALS_1a_G0000800.mRNA.1.CDS.1 [Saccharomyces cerevisiae]|nr:ALS_1a_G0000800.mRNA.1.CDS.1 [Saccharomyces cerevisiae]CAI6473112.1 ALS_1a_G0000800.mRNA.1.CDS.1 [Saccharomyces cerevisiae]
MRPSLKNTDAGNDTKTGPLNEESPDDSEDYLVSVDIILPEDVFTSYRSYLLYEIVRSKYLMTTFLFLS